MSLTKKLLFLLLGLTIFTIIMIVLFGPNGLVGQEKEHYNETHIEEMEDEGNRVIVR